MGLPIPGAKLLAHAQCDCSGTMQTVEHTHLATCSKYGRSYVRDALKHTIGH